MLLHVPPPLPSLHVTRAKEMQIAKDPRFIPEYLEFFFNTCFY